MKEEMSLEEYYKKYPHAKEAFENIPTKEEYKIEMEIMSLTCPICKGRMTPTRIECEDKSGFMFGWLCDCNAPARKELNLSELIIHTGKEREN